MPIISDVAGITSIQRLRFLAAEPVSGASIRFFRVVFGLIVMASALRLLVLGWTGTLYADPRIHFSYTAMGWVPVLPGPLMRVHVGLIAVAAAFVVLGIAYRYAIAAVWVLFTWMEFTEATVYLNHYWFISVMSFLMLFLPMSSTGLVPRGAVWMIRFQVGIVYCFAGLAKLNTDWLIRGLPMALWLPGRTDLPVIGQLLDHQMTAVVLGWGGAIFDCLVVWFMLWRRTRLWAWLCVVAFHLATFILFPPIGVFPFLMMGASLIFFDPDWPTVLSNRICASRQFQAFQRVLPDRSTSAPADLDPDVDPIVDPAVDRAVEPTTTPAPQNRPVSRIVFGAAIVWIAIQLALPLRQYLIPGDARWTGEGFRFGWNVLAVERAGDLTFRVTDSRTGRTWAVSSGEVLTTQQLRVVPVEPELIRQAAHHVADSESERLGVPRSAIEVRADAYVSVNGRRARRLIDPSVDLAAEPATLWRQDWILPGP